jgi:hypothetical protein
VGSLWEEGTPRGVESTGSTVRAGGWQPGGREGQVQQVLDPGVQRLPRLEKVSVHLLQ